ncbi:MAG: 50S ribosomal protein L13 [Candidatus Rhabdochlamydia sp.]|jgi:large subunit ribosomal protein L13|nr:large subunit ribosomal protein [Chlamydiota bacterium]
MNAKQDKTFFVTKEDARHRRKWLKLDASGKTLGRFASEVAKVLRGKHKTDFTPNTDTGDGVIIVNASKIAVTGSKDAQKIYRYHTGSMSGMREIPYRVMLDRKPEYIIWHAIKGMMPKSRLAEAQMKKLRIYAKEEHDMHAQSPKSINI